MEKLLNGLRILLVDDDADARDLGTFVMALAGADVTSTGSARQAQRTLEENEFDLIVSDLHMPERSGLDLVRQIRTGGERYAELPALALTAYATPEAEALALQAGFQAFVPKPADYRELVRTIARIARRSLG